MKKIFTIFCVLITAIVTAQTSTSSCSGVCVPLVYEEFNYSPNTPLIGKAGGSGWKDVWEVQNDNAAVPGYAIGAGNVTFSTLKSFNNNLTITNTFLSAGRNFDISTDASSPFVNFIDNNTRLIGKANTSLYFSTVLQKNDNSSNVFIVSLHQQNTASFAGSNDKISMGYFGTASETNGQPFWSFQLEQSVIKTNAPIVTNQSALLVLKMDFFNDSTRYSLFVNPTTLGIAGEPITPTLVITANKLIGFKAISILSDFTAAKMDEIRIAPTYTCSVPDNNTPYNQLPIANITNAIANGNTPFSNNFNGTTSSDPDGTIAKFNWAYSDGGLDTTASSNHIFASPGIIVAKLTVTDNCNATSSSTVKIIANNAQGFFPCYTSPHLNQFGNCDSIGGGEIALTDDAPDATSFSILNKKTNTVTTQPSNIFSNLSAGAYQLTSFGSNGCRDTFNLVVPISHECAGQAKGNLMQIGVNVENLNYFNGCPSFKDFVKTASEMLTFNANGGGNFDNGVFNEIAVDSNGYPLRIPANTSIGDQKVRALLSDSLTHMPLGDYVLLFDGDGDVTIDGGVVTNATTGRKEITITRNGNIWFEIQQSTFGNHVRNIRFVKASDEATFVTQPFQEKFLKTLCNFSTIRYMDWTATNGNTNITFAGRTKPTFYSQADDATKQKGVAYEHIIALANATGKDVWINVPHLADDNYITQMARLFKATLSPSIKVYLEYSNEVWNFQFDQTQFMLKNGPQNINFRRRYAQKAVNVFNIWHQEFGADKTRIIRVLATQAVSNDKAQDAMAETNGNFDVLSPALYFDHRSVESCANNLRSIGSTVSPTQIINCAREGFLSEFNSVAQNSKDAWMWGKQIAQYEFGQGMFSHLFGVTEPFEDSLFAAQIHPAIATLYQEVIDSVRHWNTTLINPYSLTTERKSKFGSWGHLEFIDQDTIAQPAPKYSVLLRNMNPAVQGVCLFGNNTITSSVVGDGTINSLGIVIIPNAGNKTYTITANASACIADVLVDGVSQGAINSFAFNNVFASHTISAIFTQKVEPNITINVNKPVSCIGSAVTFITTITNGGASPTLQWKVNGVDVVGSTATTFTGNSLVNGQVVSCVLVANNNCQTKSIDTSNSIIVAIQIPTTINNTLTSCKSIVFKGTTFASSTIVKDTVKSVQGCDSVITNTNIVITSIIATTINKIVKTCSTASARANAGGSGPNIIRDTLRSVQGCDSIITNTTIEVTTINLTRINNTLTSCKHVVFKGTTFASSTTVRDTVKSVQECDSIITNTNIVITPITVTTINNTLASCKSVVFKGTTFASSTTVKDTTKSVQGCDSIITNTNIVITPITVTTITNILTSCKSIVFKGTTFASSITVKDTTKSVQGCDSIITNTNIVITPITVTTINNTLTRCNSAVFNGITFVNSILVSDTLKSAKGCDSIITNTNIIISPSITPTISITASGNNVCSGSTVTFSTTLTNGGTPPAFQWLKKGQPISGATSSSFSTNSLINGDSISCRLTSNIACANIVTSNTIMMQLKTSAAPSVSIFSDKGSSVCSLLEQVTFTASTANTNGSAVSFQWKINSSNIGTNSNQFSIDANHINGVAVTCVITANNGCSLTKTAISNIITMSVTGVNASVSITANKTAVCAGGFITFTATPTNGGNNPSYQWKRQRVGSFINIGTNNDTYTTDTTIVNGDIISCIMQSNASCVSSPTAVSNTKTVVINPLPANPIITGSTTICNLSDGDSFAQELVSNNSSGLWQSSNPLIVSSAAAGNRVKIRGLSIGTSNITNTFIDTKGCSSSTTILVVVAAVTVLPITGVSAVCIGSQITLSNATVTPVGGSANWSCLINSATVNGAGIVTGVAANNAVSILYTVLNFFGCKGVASKTIAVNAIPSVPSIGYAVGWTNPQIGAGGNFCRNRVFTLAGTPAGGVWSTSNASVVSVNALTGSANTLALGTATLTYTVSNAAGCTNSRSITGTVVNCAAKGVNDENNKQNIVSVYPNPAKNSVTINATIEILGATIFITDMLGRNVLKTKLGLAINKIDISNLAPGLYSINIVGNNITETKKLIVQ